MSEEQIGASEVPSEQMQQGVKHRREQQQQRADSIGREGYELLSRQQQQGNHCPKWQAHEELKRRQAEQQERQL